MPHSLIRRSFAVLLFAFLASPAQFAFAQFAGPAPVQSLDNAEAKRMIAQGVPVIDIRREEEWRQTGVIAGSHLITFFRDAEHKQFDTKDFLRQLSAVARPNTPLILICRTGSRTKAVSEWLTKEANYRHVSQVRDGITGWIAAGLPVASYPKNKK